VEEEIEEWIKKKIKEIEERKLEKVEIPKQEKSELVKPVVEFQKEEKKSEEKVPVETLALSSLQKIEKEEKPSLLEKIEWKTISLLVIIGLEAIVFVYLLGRLLLFR
jgi:hypothetical protein